MKGDKDVVQDQIAKLDAVMRVRVTGRLVSARGGLLRVVVPDVRLGDVLRIEKRDGLEVLATVMGFDEQGVLATAMGLTQGLGPGDRVVVLREGPSFVCGDALLGRVVNGLGKVIDDGPHVQGSHWQVDRSPPSPFERSNIESVCPTGLRVVDALHTVGRGQRIAIIAPAGAGKTSLMGQLVRGCNADVVVVALVGERGREIQEFLTHEITDDIRKRTVVVVSSIDEPATVRVQSVRVATSIAEFFRACGKDVLLLVDSLTRVARAQREIGLAAGEVPVRRGYPPSVFSVIPHLLERAGATQNGSMTGFYTVLSEGAMNEDPIVEDVRATVDGHWVLHREHAGRGRFPAIEPSLSLSRVMSLVVSAEHLQAARTVLGWFAALESRSAMILAGAYERGSDVVTDQALARREALDAFVRQDRHEQIAFSQSVEALMSLSRSGSLSRTTLR